MKDNVPPGEVENVLVIKGKDKMKLNWDGPYDIDGQKVQITLLNNGQQVGNVIEVNRGIQTAVISGIEKDNKHNKILIKTVDTSGNVSKGIIINSNKLPFDKNGNYNI